jgi:hypothetical protein
MHCRVREFWVSGTRYRARSKSLLSKMISLGFASERQAQLARQVSADLVLRILPLTFGATASTRPGGANAIAFRSFPPFFPSGGLRMACGRCDPWDEIDETLCATQ